MEKKSNESEIKKMLLDKLSKITVRSDDDVSVILAKGRKTKITVSKSYNIEEFRFTPGQFIQMIYGCDCHPKNEIALCVGVGTGCPDDEEREEFWFLMEEDDGICHFCGSGAEQFNEWENDGELILLEPAS